MWIGTTITKGPETEADLGQMLRVLGYACSPLALTFFSFIPYLGGLLILIAWIWQLAAGTIPADGGTQRLPRLIGRGKAIELILTAGVISAQEAFDIGLVSRIIPQKELASEAEALAKKMSTQAPISLRYVKEAVNKGLDMTLEQGLRLEGDLYFLIHTTDDRTEGIKSFIEKRTPEFKGE